MRELYLPPGYVRWFCEVCTASCTFEAMCWCARTEDCSFNQDQPEANDGAFEFMVPENSEIARRLWGDRLDARHSHPRRRYREESTTMPPDLATLRALEDRLERATEASRDLDQAIMVVVAGWRLLGPYVGPNGSSMVLVDDKGNVAREPELSGSIDAAVALCERARPADQDHWTLNILESVIEAAQWRRVQTGKPGLEFLPLAICLALVRALIARGEHA